MADGQVADSRKINWRQVEWEKVIKIVTHMDGRAYDVDCSGRPQHKFFMCFRWGGRRAVFKDGVFSGHKPIHVWTQGWTDGEMCELQDIDFFTGAAMKYTAPLTDFTSHIHPRVMHMLKK